MTTPISSVSPVPTSQRPLNGAVLSGMALAMYAAAIYFGAPEFVAAPAALAVGAALSTAGDWARGELTAPVPKIGIAKLFYMLAARAG